MHTFDDKEPWEERDNEIKDRREEKKHEIRLVLLNINEWVRETMYEYKPLLILRMSIFYVHWQLLKNRLLIPS